MPPVALPRLPLSFAILTLACGGGDGARSVPSAAAVATFTFSSSGVSPRSVSVPTGGCVVVRNSDSSDHDVAPDDLQACPELVGTTTLVPGQEWDWCGFGNGPKTCGFHDPSRTLAGGADPAFSGRIEVSAP